MPHEQTPQKPTPGPSGTQWLEDVFRKPSQDNEPPIPGHSHSSESQVPSHEDALICEPEPEVALKRSMEEPFLTSPLYFFYSDQLSLTPPSTISSSSHYSRSIIIINNAPISSPPPLLPWFLPWRS
ncbi:hypothetical protein O181_100954 [Austropuccinia psidii MF-1]|uniref:Uncharacterized protein n=1 Tax=Austropuccinia psidii MF-1 TaxID=1389203 RepID=A0A9Q3JFL8_9BASI|nr:hypothetical protein [Austropuccinia psidii MF-1]